MTKNDVKMLKAKKELLERQIQAIYEDLDYFADRMNAEKFYPADDLEDWNEAKKEINNLYKKAVPLHEIRDYLKDVLDSIEQSDLDEYKKDKGGEDEG